MRNGDGSGDPEILVETDASGEFYIATSFLSDARTLILTHTRDNKSDLVLLPTETVPGQRREPGLLLPDASNGLVSPDGRWLAYVSDASGRNEVYLRSITQSGKIGREIPVTRDGCAGHVWRRGNGAAPLELWYGCRTTVYSVTISTEPDLRISKPEIRADDPELFRMLKTGLAFLPDGRIIAGIQGDDEVRPDEISVTLNWVSELDARMAAGN